MFKKFKQVLQDHHLLDSNKKVLLAVSGGVDSIVLFDLMKKIPRIERPQINIAHINHQLRPESDEEEEFVRELALKHQIPIYTHHWLKENHPETGIEEAARIERYTFFKKIMNRYELDCLMTGHHLDDQVETILMRLTRGASLEQLLGIRVSQKIQLENREGQLIRPLLHISKEDIYKVAQEQRLAFVEDATNKKLDFTRNRFRNKIIPLLKEENNRFNEHVQQFTEDLADLLAISEEPAQQAYHKIVHSYQDQITLNLKIFTHYSKVMQRSVIKRVLEKLYLGETDRYKTNYIDLVCSWLLEGEVNSSLDLIGSNIVVKSYETAIFKNKEKQVEENHSEPETFKIEGTNQWISLSETEAIGLFVKDEQRPDIGTVVEELLIAEGKLHLPLRIRHRKPGDRMTYKGLAGSKKLSAIFIDDKTPPKVRNRAWLVEDQQGKIIWLISHRKMNLFTEEETDKLCYSLKYIKK